MHLAHLLLRQARRQPERVAILSGTAPHASWHDWAARSAGLATRLRAAGFTQDFTPLETAVADYVRQLESAEG